ncbi:MAG: hypothetical protein H6737_19995 [Alphaproteobacteria bacterium]|nr:hypothetical protein [Alphaproteobacteria bacterium]
MAGDAPARADGLVHPVPIAAIALLVVNDHWLKHAYGGLVTGKLSDIAGMVFFPLLLQAFVELADRREPFRPRRSALIACAVATGLVFGSTNLFEWAADAYRVGLGVLQWPFRALFAALVGADVPGLATVRLTQDPTDVLAVPFVAVAVAVGWRRATPPEAPSPSGLPQARGPSRP